LKLKVAPGAIDIVLEYTVLKLPDPILTLTTNVPLIVTPVLLTILEFVGAAVVDVVVVDVVIPTTEIST
jgi:hypothetical protein